MKVETSPAQIPFSFAPVQTQPAPPSQKEVRDQKKKAAYAATSDQWKADVWDFAVNVYLANAVEPFIFEQLTSAYEAHAKRTGKSPTVEKRAFAMVQKKLLKGGFMAVVDGETGRSYEGNLRPKYRSLI